MRDIELIAHRGASHDAPENTLASFHLERRGMELRANSHPPGGARYHPTVSFVGIFLGVPEILLGPLV